MKTELSIMGLIGGLTTAVTGCVQVEKLDDAGDSVPTEVQRVFDERCAIAPCHDAGSRAGNLSLSAADAAGIIGRPSGQNSALSLVEPGSVEESYLAAKVLPTPPEGVDVIGDIMPPGANLSDNALATDMAIIVGWIAGAELPGGDDGSDGIADGGDGLQACGIQDAMPGATSPLDAGLEPGQIPPSVGTVLADNCGCHYVSETSGALSGWAYTTLPMATVDDFQATYPGANPDYAGLRTHEAILDRVASDRNMPRGSASWRAAARSSRRTSTPSSTGSWTAPKTSRCTDLRRGGSS